jgi:protein-tyrosine-phosphatase
MAEGLAQNWLENSGHGCWQAVSAGTLAISGTPTSSETIQTLLQRGIEFNGTSKPLTGDMIRSAHIVLCMTQTHADVATHLVGDHTKVDLFDTEGSIPDPVGSEQVVYDALAEKMEQLIEVRLEAIIKKAGNT